MKETQKDIIGAVLAALFLSVAALVIALNARSPVAPLAGVGDTYLLLNYPLAAESRLMGSDAKLRLESSLDGFSFLRKYETFRDGVRDQLGSSYYFMGWNARFAIALRPNGSPVTSINPGVFLSPFGDRFFKKAGFRETTIGGQKALQKGDVIMAGARGCWILGDADGVGSAIEAARNQALEKDRARLNKLGGKIDSSSPINVILTPSGIIRHVGKLFSDKTAQAFEDWAMVSSWDGMALGLTAGRKRINIQGKALVAGSPLPYFFRHMNGTEFADWLTPDTNWALRLGVPRPLSIWQEARRQYENKPAPTDVMNKAETELKKELDIDLVDLLDHLRDEVGFVQFGSNGKQHTILVAGVALGTEKYLQELETKVPGQWKSTFTEHPMRYMKRLLAYAMFNGKLVIASDVATLESYLVGVKQRKEVAESLTELAKDYSFAPMAMTGTLFGESDSATFEKAIPGGGRVWYGVAVDRKKDELGVRMAIPGKMGPKLGPPWSIRFMMWTFSLIRLVIYALMISAFSTVIFRSARLIRFYRA